MKNTWQMQAAKNDFCAVAAQAAGGQPQTVTKHGRPFVVIVSAEKWRRSRAPRRSALATFRACPADLTKILPPRSPELPREIAL